MVSSARLKWLHELAERTKAAEHALKFKDDDRPLTARIHQLRLIELRDRTMTPEQLAEHRQLEREMQKDLDDYNSGGASGDWTK